MGHLSHKDVRTGVVFGFFKDVLHFGEVHNTRRFAFCWDCGAPKRREVLPCYKLRRHTRERTPEEQLAYDEMKAQVHLLRTLYLRKVGFRNIFYKKGFESDDFIGSLAHDLPDDDEAVIISSDADLYQLIKPNVSLHNPHTGKRVTLQSFKQEHGLHPKRWAMVKAIAGCSGDEVPGVPGVGEKTAIKYLLGQLKDTSAAWNKINSPSGRRLIELNKTLVKLPFAGTPRNLELRDDRCSEEGWDEMCTELGLKSLRGRAPFSRHGKRIEF